MKPIFNRFVGILLFLGMTALFGFAVMFLWNALLPDIAGLSIISYWQAVGLFMLARILFGGIGGAFQGLDRRNLFYARWIGMSRAERESFLKRHEQGFHNHFHRGEHDPFTDDDSKKE